MGQASPFKPIALVVDDDATQREMVAMLLEENEMGVVQCDSAEAALRVLDRIGSLCSILFTDVSLAGKIDGVELAHFVKQQFPNIHVVVTSGVARRRNLPEGTTFMPKPWRPLDVLREVARCAA